MVRIILICRQSLGPLRRGPSSSPECLSLSVRFVRCGGEEWKSCNICKSFPPARDVNIFQSPRPVTDCIRRKSCVIKPSSHRAVFRCIWHIPPSWWLIKTLRGTQLPMKCLIKKTLALTACTLFLSNNDKLTKDISQSSNRACPLN